MPWWTSLVGPAASLWDKTARWWCQPVLRIEFHESRTYDVVRLPEYNGALGRFCHFFVYNDGRATARHARARLMSAARVRRTTTGTQLRGPPYTKVGGRDRLRSARHRARRTEARRSVLRG